MQDPNVESNLHYLKDQVGSYEEALQFKSLGVDLLFDDASEKLSPFKNWLSGANSDLELKQGQSVQIASVDSIPVELNWNEFGSFQPGKVGAMKSPVLLVCLDEALHEENEMLFKLKKKAEGRALVYFVFPKESASYWRNVKMEIGKEAMKVETQELEKLGETTFTNWISSEGMVKVLGGFQAYSLARSLFSVSEVIKLTIDQQGRELGGMKLVTQQDANRVKSSTGGSREAMDVMSSVKSIVQESVTSYQKGLKKRFEDLYKTNIGTIWKEMDEWAESLDELAHEKRTKKVIVTVPEEFKEEYLNHMHEVIHQSLTTDLIILKDTLHQIQNEVDRVLNKHGIKGGSVNFSYVTDSALNRILESAIRIDRPYQGEGQKKGPMEYFMAIRRYQMVFFMLLSTFGGAATMLKRRLEILLPLTIVLLSAGGYFVVTGVKKEREDQDLKDLEKARESLKSEYKRIFSDVQRDWFSTMDENVREQSTKALNKIETVVKGHYEDKAQKLDREKESIQRKSKSLDGKESKLLNLKKAVDTTSMELKKFQMDLRRWINESLRASKMAAK